MASIKRILRSYPRKNSQYFKLNGLFICPKIYFAWLKLALWSRMLLIQRWNFLTFFLPVNTRCWSNVASINWTLHSYPWKKYSYFNWNGLFVCPKIYFAWLKLALWSWIAYFTALNFWPFRRQSTLNVSQTWLRWDKSCPHVRGKLINILTQMGRLYVRKYILLETCAFIQKISKYRVEILTFSPAVSNRC